MIDQQLIDRAIMLHKKSTGAEWPVKAELTMMGLNRYVILRHCGQPVGVWKIGGKRIYRERRFDPERLKPPIWEVE